MDVLHLLQSGLVVIFLPGALFILARQGLRGQMQWQFVVSSLFVGLCANAFLIFFFGIALCKYALFDPMDIVLGYTKLASQSLEVFITRPYGPDTLSLLVGVYAACLAAGFLWRWSDARRNGKPFSIQTGSALDVEMFRLRDRKIAPTVALVLASGETVEGKCRTYTFTEPREIILEVEEGENKSLRWFRLDDNVKVVSLKLSAGETEKRPLIFLKRV